MIRKPAVAMAIVMLALSVPAAVVLTITALGNGTCQIVAPGNSPDTHAVHCVLLTTTDFLSWTSLRTNTFPLRGYGDGVTNVVEMTNARAFYRVRIQ
jgi:hypothetical protein